jgi:phosphoribosylglycinamide formyltransferase-1
MPINLTVLVSGSGTTLQNLIDVIARKELDAQINLVIGSRAGLGAEARAVAARIRYEVVPFKEQPSIDAFSHKIWKLCDSVGTDLVVCAGWLARLKLDSNYAQRVINVHPALLPSFGGKGMYGRHVHEAVLAHGCKVTGCTVHFLDDEYDNGPIILQRTCEICEGHTAEQVAECVQAQERIALPEAIRLIQSGRVSVNGRRVRIRHALS